VTAAPFSDTLLIFMKIFFPVLVLILGCCLSLRAQTPDVAPADTAGTTPAPDPDANTSAPHNIMAWSTGHKPNPTDPPAEIAVPIEKFFAGLKAGDYAGAYETFLAGTRLGAQKDKMSAMVSRTEEGFGIYGKMNDYEIYDNYSIGTNVVVLTYLARHDVQPLRWRFIYYRPDKSWHLINLGFDDFLLDMLN
jgi:hypothetical protein